MNREVITPKSRQEWLAIRTMDITSTEVSALFNASPYLTEYELWHQKKSQSVTEIEGNERMDWGTRLQAPIAEGLALQFGLKVEPMPEYIRIPELRIGSSFDYKYDGGIFEVKNVDSLAYKNGWLDTEAPLYIEFQHQHQLLVSGRTHGKIGALVGGNTGVLLEREADAKIHAAILDRCAAFWKSIYENRPPKPNFERDASFIVGQYGFANPGKVYNATGNAEMSEMVLEYAALGRVIKQSETTREEIKAKILMEIKDSEKVVSDTFSITAGVVGPTHVEYERAGYRGFRVYPKKDKKS